MSLVSVVIPSRRDPDKPDGPDERFLGPTVKDILSKARGDVEVIAVLEGYWPKDPLPDDDRLVLVHHGKAQGMRQAINAGVDVARGEYIMKLDSHCMVDEGFDEVLKADCAENWVVVPRRYALDAEEWTRIRGRTPIDYMFLSYPNFNGDPVKPGEARIVSNPGDRGGNGLHGRPWDQRNRDPKLKETLIDDLMSAQGSCYFMRRDYFHDLELLDADSYGSFGNEFQEVGLKCWLSGGRVVRNKNTWYAHLHKGKKYGRGWRLGRTDADQAVAHTNKWVTNEAWEKQMLPFDSLIKKFWPVPGWPAEWGP